MNPDQIKRAFGRSVGARWLAVFLAMLIVWNAPASARQAAESPAQEAPEVQSTSASSEEEFALSPSQGNTTDAYASSFTYYDDVKIMLIGEPTTGKILLEKNADTAAGIASMSKLMTYWIVKNEIRDGKLQLDQSVVVSPTAAEYNVAGSSNYGLQPGETYSIERLLFGMMTVSGNDAAALLAEAVAGSEAQFAVRMNDEARALGLDKTNFVNASGFTVDGKYNVASARDMFVLASRILKEFPEVKEYAKVQEVLEPERQFSHRSTIAEASVDIPGITGLKTGSTDEAGYCFTGSFDLTSTADGSSFEAVTVVMDAPTPDARWRTTKELVDLAAGSFSHVSVVDAATPVSRMEVRNAEEGSVVLYPAESFSVFTFANKPFEVHYNVTSEVEAPTDAEQKFGEIEVYQDGNKVKTIDIVAHEPTHRVNPLTQVQRGIEGLVSFLTGLI
ncbi:MAG: D-alanyl-D-alanine carboxypeptidase [Peptoniphilaceae bacterium]|nr:D-alanyl-D-alanine carboxypeptidase [Peptoniphilaceae bacterium]MDY6085370.1 D-alanyl-D-alanine carboxypeptidase family protein [Peptoniphilaceae bacterium]